MIFFIRKHAKKILPKKKKNRERLRKEASERYQNLSKEEKDKKPKKAHETYPKFSDNEREKSINIIVSVIQKQMLVEYKGNFYITYNK